MEDRRKYRIPPERQAEVLRLHYTGSSDRQVYLALYPQGTSGAPKLGTFADALRELLRETDDSVRRLASEERVPYISPTNPPGDAECAELCLTEPVGEEPLAPGDEAALADLDTGRAALCHVLSELTSPDNPPPDAPPEESGRWIDPLAERAKVVAIIAGALSTNVAVRLRGASVRVARTVTLHNLRLARLDEAEEEETSPPSPGETFPAPPGRPEPARGRVPAGSPTGGFLLDLPSPGKA